MDTDKAGSAAHSDENTQRLPGGTPDVPATPPLSCPTCGQLNEAGRAFCRNCGYALTAPPAPSAYPAASVTNPLPPYSPPPVYAPPAAYAPPTAYGGYTSAGTALVPPTNNRALGAMICGILGIVFGCLFPPLGIIMAVVALVLVRQYNKQRSAAPQVMVNPSEGGYVRIGQITGIIGLVLALIFCALVVLYFVGIAVYFGFATQLTPVP